MISSEMKVTLYIIAIAAIVAGLAASVVLIIPEEAKESFDIDYNLNGGTNSSDNPSSYSINKTVDFKTPTREGYVFEGWYSDPGFNNRVWSTENMEGDVQLYAKWHQKQTYTITYVMNGGMNSPHNPDTYVEDSVVMLSQPTKTNNVFYGWHYKADFSDDRIDYIARHTDADVTLYAQWAIDRSGYTLYYNDSGYYQTSADWMPMTINGSTRYTYLNYTYEKGYHVKCAENNNLSTATTSYWTTDHDQSKWTLTGHETISYYDLEEEKEKEVYCSIYEATLDSGEKWTEYICESDGIPYKMEMYHDTLDEENGMMISITYDFTSKSYTPVSSTYNVTIYNDEGISSEGSGDYKSLTELTLKASSDEGYTFAGWYSTDGVCVDSSKELYIEMLSEDIILFARNSLEYDDEFYNDVTLEPYKTLKSVAWQYFDNEGNYSTMEGNIFKYRYETAGDYVITYSGYFDDGSVYYGMYRIICKGDITRTYIWECDSMMYSMNLSISYDDYLAYRYSDTARSRTYSYVLGKFTFDDEHTASFVVDDEYIQDIATWFKAMKSLKGWTDLQTANCLLCFVQSIPYVTDIQSKGVSEYWKYPLETLYEECGDCEDTSFLYCSIAKALGYQTALLLFHGHMAASVNVYGASGYQFTYTSGPVTLIYYFCETTSEGWKVGYTPAGYTQDGYYYNYYVPGTGVIEGAVIPV